MCLEYILESCKVILKAQGNLRIQWNPSIEATIGEGKYGLYRGYPYLRGQFELRKILWDMTSRESVLTSGVVSKRGSTVVCSEYSGASE